jgi:hypothetical protein
MSAILNKLKCGDLRSKGKSEEVVTDILKHPYLFGEDPEYLKDHKKRVIAQ